MKPSDVEARVAQLRALVGRDDEAACSGSEQLRCEVLQEIAAGNPDAIELAAAAMCTIDEDIGGD
jgi:hypothetical protein